MRDDLRAYVLEHLARPEAVLILDETGFVKKGEKSVGVQRQYSGTAGRVENYQIGVFLAYAADRSCACINRALYLPKGWCGVTPAAKLRACRRRWSSRPSRSWCGSCWARAVAAGVPFGWVTADEVYGSDPKLRAYLEAQHLAYVFAVRRSTQLWQGFQPYTLEEWAQQRVGEPWTRLSAGKGAKGGREYDWAWQSLPRSRVNLPTG